MKKSAFDILDKTKIKKKIAAGLKLQTIYNQMANDIPGAVRPSYFAFCKYVSKHKLGGRKDD